MKNKELNFDLKQLRSFLTVTEEKSFTRASRTLRVGQATISSHMRSLEETLGVILIRRSSRDFTVTREGLLFREFCQSVFRDIEKLNEELSREDVPGVTRLAASTIPSAYILPAVLARLKRLHPKVLYRVETGDSRGVIEMVKEGTAEAGISGKMIRHPSLAFQKIHSDEIVLIAPAVNYPDSVSLPDLKKLPFVTRARGSGTRDCYEKYLSGRGISPSGLNIVLECSGTEIVKEAVLAGMGVAFISRLAVRRESGQGRIKVIETGGAAIRRDFYLLYQKKRSVSAPVKALMDELKKLKK